MKREAGFTLIEMIMVIALIATMLAFSIPNFQTGKIRQDVKSTARKFASDLRYAQTQTLAQKAHSETDPVHSVGLYLEKDAGRYTLFEDTDGNKQYEHGVDADLAVTSFQNGVLVKNIALNSPSGTANNKVTIMFSPTGETSSVGSPSCYELDCTQKLFIEFSSDKLTSELYDVVVNPSGLIEKP
jgi:prepilin-type N-terminal cleavage/methylation domain-containing protein